MIALGIESSCDETAVAVVRDREILANVVSSQLAAHRPFGGVVPELAARMHLEALGPALRAAFGEAGISLADVDLVCATRGPGLIGALLVGLQAAKALAWVAGKPFVGVNHVMAHVYANFFTDPPPGPPLVCLTVSGGHTDLLFLAADGTWTVLGRTRDDAAGECLDKIARVLGLGYPGGPALEKLAADGMARFELPQPIIGGALDFSFSGLKTAVINMHHRLVQKGGEVPRADIAASAQAAVVEGLVSQLKAAVSATGVRTILLAGGVAANGPLRAAAAALARNVGAAFYVPPLFLCTDNAAMVAGAGLHRYQHAGPDPLSLSVEPGLDFDQA